MATRSRIPGAALGLFSSLVLPWTMACPAPAMGFRGTTYPITLRAGESAHFTLVATRAAVDQADNGLTFRALPATLPLTAIPDDASLDELFTGGSGSISATELRRICPLTTECLIGVTVTLGEGPTGPSDLFVRFGLESYGGFTRDALALAELD